MKKPTHNYLGVCIIFVATVVLGINSPPGLRSAKKWTAEETRPVGSVLNTLEAFDHENDQVTFSLEPNDVMYNYLKIDEHNNVVIAKPLTGLIEDGQNDTSYIVNVRLSDGSITTITQVRFIIRRHGVKSSTQRGFGGSRLPHGFNHPGGLRGLPGVFPGHSNIPNNPPSHPPNHPLNHQPNHLQSNDGPPVLTVNGPWTVRGDAELGSQVAKVDVIDVVGAGFNLTMIDPKHLLTIDKFSGRVTLSAPITGKEDDYTVTVQVNSPWGNIPEPVLVRIQPPPQKPSPQTPTHQPNHPPTTNGATNQQDLRVVGGSSVGGSSVGGSTVGVSTTPTPKEESSVNLTVIPIVVVAGLSPLLLILYCCYRRYRKINSSSKKTSVVYSEKGEEAAATEIRTEGGSERERNQRIASSILNFSALWRRSAYSNKYEEGLRDSKNQRRVSEVSSSNTDNWEFPRHRLRVISILGEGCFGQVWKCESLGLAGQRSLIVASKTLKESAGDRERRDLLQELKVLKSLAKHPNVVSLLGCCTEKDPIFVILEYMSGGKLQSYLRASRGDAAYNNLHGTSSLTPRDLTLFSYQIARGMEFLASNGIIHRDLAARNVLVGEEKVCKVADFGFARDVANNHVYERKSDGRLPIRWMAPESLFDNIFTTKSDVWSFGVLLWEIVTLGSTPYPGHGAAEVMKKVKEGYRLEKPDHCRREIYNIMYYCWDKEQKERPSFSELVTTLEGLLLSEVEYIQLDRFPDHTYYNFITEKSDELL